jgi:hypothetical protein
MAEQGRPETIDIQRNRHRQAIDQVTLSPFEQRRAVSCACAVRTRHDGAVVRRNDLTFAVAVHPHHAITQGGEQI